MSQRDGPLLVIGVGNILLRDEGVGVHVIRNLDALATGDELELPAGTRLVDGGTLGLNLLPLIDEARALVLVDAVDLGSPPGTVAVLRGAAIEGTLTGHVSPHQVGIGDLVAAARLTGTLPDAVALVGIQPEAVEVGLELTPAVEEAMARACAAVRSELLAFAGTGQGAAA